ncbi:MAG: hypothetical protein NWR54_15995 [Paracoccaceae bacterium]|nr:hypothetical protein [Paracoccaceae bacterium]
MDHAKITQVLESLPAGALSQHRFVRHYFYGPDTRLRRVRTHLKRLSDDMMFDFLDKGLAVTAPARLDHDGLMQAVGIMESSAAETGLEYDGFEIVLDDVEDQAALEPLEDHVAPGSYLRFALGAGRFGYLLFLGGNKTDGYLFDCLALVDDGQATPEILAEAPRLYRQPVQGMIDPFGVEVTGTATGMTHPILVPFRLATDYPTPEDLAALAARHGMAPDRIEQDWPVLLERLVAAGQTIGRGDPIAYTAELKRNGRITWTEGDPIRADPTTARPMLFGAHVTLDSLRTALTGGRDIVALTDAAS